MTSLTGEVEALPCNCQMQAEVQVSHSASADTRKGCSSLLLGSGVSPQSLTWSPLTLWGKKGIPHYWLVGMKIQTLYLVFCNTTPLRVLGHLILSMRVEV